MRHRPILAAAALSACASVSQVPASVSKVRDAGVPVSIEILEAVQGMSSAGISNAIRAGTVWNYFGVIEEGYVYRPRDAVLTVEGANIDEAWLVVSEGDWVGYYLPVER